MPRPHARRVTLSPLAPRAFANRARLERRDATIGRVPTHLDRLRSLARWAPHLAVASLLATIGTLLLHRYNVPLAQARDLPPINGGIRRDVVSLELTEPLMGVLFPFVGWLVLRRQPRNAIGLVCLSATVMAFKCLFGEYAVTAYLVHPGLPLGAVAAWLTMWGWTPYLLLMTLLPLLYPDGRLPSPRWKWVAYGSIASFVGSTLVLMVLLAPIDSSHYIDNPLGFTDATWLRALMFFFVGSSFFVWMPAAGVAVVLRLRRARGPERARMLWGLVGAAMLVLSQTLPLATRERYVDYVGSVGFVAFAVAIVVGTTFYGDARRDVVLNRTLVLAILGVLGVAAYAIAVGVVHRAMPGRDQGVWVIAVIAVLAVLARDAVQRVVERWLYGDRRDPYAVVTRVGGRLDAATGPLDALTALVAELAAALRAPYVAVLPDDPLIPAARIGQPGAHLEVVPIAALGKEVGALEVGVRHERERFRGDELTLLADVAGRAGTLLYAASLVSDLQRSRERIVAAREEERRRLRHDLHDGLGPQLAGMALQLESLSGRLEPGSDAEQRVGAMRDRMRHMVSEVRRVVDDLRPAALDQFGLVAALREHAAGLTSRVSVGAGVADSEPGLDIRVVAGDLPDLPAAVEVAAYRIATEALTNVLRHARATTASVSLGMDAGVLTLDITDDGQGITASMTPGVGLRSMRERAAELGGEFSVVTTDSGTTVTARLPVEAV